LRVIEMVTDSLRYWAAETHVDDSFRPWYDSRPRTQQGNNNAYCQDNEISWVDWEIGEEGEALIRFVQQLTALRHKYPILRRSRFLTGVYNEELSVKDVT
jgi:isoamylase